MEQKSVPVIYYTKLCPDCIRALAQFKFNRIEVMKINIKKKKKAMKFVKEINNGFASVPTIIFPNGDILVEPSYLELNLYIVNNLNEKL